MPSRNEPYGLAKIETLLAELGNPHHGQRYVHVGGTAGKGSTATMVASILVAAGYRTGLHVSPEVFSIGERAAVDLAPLPPDELVRLVTRIKPTVVRTTRKLGTPPSYFELWVALALTHFAEQQTDINVIEVGMGGTLDGTNVIDARHQIITNIGLEHTDILGDTKEQILRDKQGIIKPGSTVVSGIRERGLRSILRRQAAATKSRLLLLGEDFRFEHVRPVRRNGLPAGQTFDFRSGKKHRNDIGLSLLGGYQPANASLAIAMTDALSTELPGISELAIRRGLAEARIPGRLQIVRTEPLEIFDVAHSRDKVRALVEGLRVHFPGRRFVTVVRYRPKPDIWDMLAELGTISSQMILTGSRKPLDSGPEPVYNARTLAKARKLHGAEGIMDPREALRTARQHAKQSRGGVLVTGSAAFVSELLTKTIRSSSPIRNALSPAQPIA